MAKISARKISRSISKFLLLPLLALLPMSLLSAGTGAMASTAQSSTPAPTPTPTTRPILLTDPAPDPQQEGVLYFPATGHTLRGPFLLYWQQHGGLAQFGYPLTEEFTEPIGPDSAPIMVQYFERNRFEHHPENQPPSDVLLGTLGREFLPPSAPTANADPLPAPTLYFEETGHNLSGTLQQYWQEHGGLAVHGYPITEAFEEVNPTDHKAYLVQYFERSRFELHPENAGSPYEVLLGQLGRQLSEKRGYPYGWYPLYGHAADFSWAAGRPIPRRDCFARNCSCTFVSDIQVQPVGPAWTAARSLYSINVILFGYLAKPGEPTYSECLYPGYIVISMQRSPANPDRLLP